MWPLFGKKLNHPTFRAMRAYRDGKFWRSHLLFSPVQRKVWVTVHAGKSGPTSEQERLYKTLIVKYDQLIPRVTRALLMEYQRVRAAHPHVKWPKASEKDLFQIIPLHRLWLEEGPGHPFVLSYQSKLDKDHEFHVFFKQGKLRNVSFER
jgi:hypothetical protein